MFCYRCGTKLPDTARMCFSCRTVFNSNFINQQQQYNNTNNLRYTPDPRANQPTQFGIPQNQNSRRINQGFVSNKKVTYNPPPVQQQQMPSADKIASAVVGRIIFCLILIFVVTPLVIKFVKAFHSSGDTAANSRSAYTEVSSTPSTTESQKKETTTEKQNSETYTTEEPTTEAIQVATVEDSVIYEGNDVIVELKSLEGNTLSFYIENNSSKNLSSSLHAYAVNGAMADNNMFDMYKSIAANSKTNITFEIPSVLESGYEVNEIRRLDFLIWFYDDDASFKAFDTGVLTVETSLYDGTLAGCVGDELLDENGVSYTLLDKNQHNVVIGITNNTENYYTFSGKNVVINGYTLDTTYNLDLYDKMVFPNCSYAMLFDFDWDSDNDFKKNNGITVIENVTFNFDVRPNDDYFSEFSSSKVSVDY